VPFRLLVLLASLTALGACSTAPPPAPSPTPEPTPAWQPPAGSALTPSVMRAAIAQHPPVLQCIDDARATGQGELPSEVKLSLLVTPGGQVTAASLPDFDQTEFETCMRGALSSVELPTIPEEAHLTYPMPVEAKLEVPRERLRPKEVAARVREAASACDGSSGLTLGLSIDANGRVSSVIPLQAEHRETPLAECLTQHVGPLTFAPPLKGRTNVSVPLP
jgi:hypothetical protein